MDIKTLADKYKLSQSDFWECHGNWIIKHDAIEKIMAQENMYVSKCQSLYQDADNCRLWICVAIHGQEENLLKIQGSIGEASKSNSKNSYLGSMAEKRGIDRCVLKLINAYQYNIYSEVEADDFKQADQQPATEIKDYSKVSNTGLDHDQDNV